MPRPRSVPPSAATPRGRHGAGPTAEPSSAQRSSRDGRGGSRAWGPPARGSLETLATVSACGLSAAGVPGPETLRSSRAVDHGAGSTIARGWTASSSACSAAPRSGAPACRWPRLGGASHGPCLPSCSWPSDRSRASGSPRCCSPTPAIHSARCGGRLPSCGGRWVTRSCCAGTRSGREHSRGWRSTSWRSQGMSPIRRWSAGSCWRGSTRTETTCSPRGWRSSAAVWPASARACCTMPPWRRSPQAARARPRRSHRARSS